MLIVLLELLVSADISNSYVFCEFSSPPFKNFSLSSPYLSISYQLSLATKLLLISSLALYYHHVTDWVIQLGPPTYQGYYYEYAVVTDRYDINLFVLARNVTDFKLNYDAEVLSKLKSQGFTKFYNKPRDIYQGTDCVYIQ